MKLSQIRLAVSAAHKGSRVDPHATVGLGRMRAWQLHQFGSPEDLQLGLARLPPITAPDQVRVKVQYSSVNPLDVAMTRGYGSTVFSAMRGFLSTPSPGEQLPLTLGRDFSGVLDACGTEARAQGLVEGTEVWGVVPPHWAGAHAERVVSRAAWVARRPAALTRASAACLYAALTAHAGLYPYLSVGCKVGRALVLGVGGVGAAAVQLLRAAGATVVVACAGDAAPLATELGAHLTVDRHGADYERELLAYSPYDLIVDCAGLGSEGASSVPWQYKHYVTFTSPVLRETDSRGLLAGTIFSAGALAQALRSKVRWAYFVPSAQGIKQLGAMAERGEYQVPIDSIYPFEEAPKAFARMKEGHLRGKVVLDLTSSSV